jgi:enamine deaminase RidA (YjgF/YER057c/UK114 family)
MFHSIRKGNYVSFVRIGNTLHLSGHIPATSKGLIKGKLGADLSVDEGYNSAKTCAINILATLKEELGTLDNVKQIVKIVGFVACTDDFTQQPSVINGASDFFVEVFGEKGNHARSAVGTNALPLGIPTEVECIVEVES